MLYRVSVLRRTFYCEKSNTGQQYFQVINWGKCIYGYRGQGILRRMSYQLSEHPDCVQTGTQADGDTLRGIYCDVPISTVVGKSKCISYNNLTELVVPLSQSAQRHRYTHEQSQQSMQCFNICALQGTRPPTSVPLFKRRCPCL